MSALTEETRDMDDELPNQRPWPCSSKASWPNFSVMVGSVSSRLILSDSVAGDAVVDVVEGTIFGAGRPVCKPGGVAVCVVDGLLSWGGFPFSVVIIWGLCLLVGSFYGTPPSSHAEGSAKCLTTCSARKSTVLGSA